MYNSGKFTQDMIMEWIGKPPADQTYANARTFFQGKLTGMGNAARLTGNTSATHGFGTAASATELKEISEALMGAMKEAPLVWLSRPMPRRHGNGISGIVSWSASLPWPLYELLP